MKSVIKILSAALFLSIVMLSCKKDENRIYYEGGTTPILTADIATTIPLSNLTKDAEAINLSWTNPNYQLNTGISSVDVNYLIEVDTAGANFSNPKREQLLIGKDLSKFFTQSDFNDFLLNQMLLDTSTLYNIEIRVTASLGTSATALVSNVLKYKVIPFPIPPKVELPASGHLYLVGSATAGGWNNPVPVPTQEFTQLTNTSYEITVALTGGQEYLLLPTNGDWSHKYAVKDKTLAGLNLGGDFGKDLSDNFPGPTASGNYKIEVDFQHGKFKVTPQ